MQPVTRKIFYTILVISCTAFAGFIFMNGKSKTEFPALKERTGVLAQDPEWPTTQKNVANLLAQLKTKPDDTKTMLLLAKEFMQEARVTGNYSYYNKTALDLTNDALRLQPKNLDAICYQSMIYLSQHRFAEGKDVAMKGMEINPYNAFIYGLLVDANVELGDYDAAVKMADKMNSIRPDLRSYSRISYLREIFGDVPGSMEAVKMAVDAGYPGREDTEWARMVWAHLYEDSNQLDKALEQYNMALAERPNYPFALAGLGRIAKYNKDYPSAIQYYEKARVIMSDASFYEELIDVYQLNNQPDKAKECAQVTLNALLSDNIAANTDKNSGHYSDRDIANLYLILGNTDKAFEHAQTEHNRRPLNIDANETMAWVLYQQSKYAEAAPYVTAMLRTNIQKPEYLVKAGIIMEANGQTAAGKVLIDKGLSLKPYMDEALVKTAQSVNFKK
jgi:tetratricopeptide (TPR) repeat protein